MKQVSTDDCLLWAGPTTDRGYGLVNLVNPNGRPTTMQAHRAVYQDRFGELPKHLVLDHLCRVTSCINPDHLEPVTCAENLRRGIYWQKLKTHCKRGHPYSEENTYRNKKGWRWCRTCTRLKEKRYLIS